MPIRASPADDDYLASVEINDEQEYTINGYDMDQETECVRVITIMTTLKYDSSAAILIVISSRF